MSRMTPTPATRHCVSCQRLFEPLDRNQYSCAECPAMSGAALESAVLAQAKPADAGSPCPCCWGTVPYRRKYCSDRCKGRRARAGKWLVLSRDARKGRYRCLACNATKGSRELYVVRIDTRIPRTAGNVVSMCMDCLAVSPKQHHQRMGVLTQAARDACTRIDLPPTHEV